MPGSLVRDTLAPVLQNGTITATTTGSAVQVERPGKVRVRLKTGTVTSTTNSATLSVEVQASDDNTFGTGVVSLGRFSAMSGTDASQSNATKYLQAYCAKRYVRTVATVAGTAPSYGSLVVDLVEPNYERTRADTA